VEKQPVSAKRVEKSDLDGCAPALSVGVALQRPFSSRQITPTLITKTAFGFFCAVHLLN
jgi:hypothetical protein